MYELRLSDADRERFGVADEWLPLDLGVLMQDEAEVLDEHGVDIDPWPTALNGVPRVKDGQPETWPNGTPRYRRPVHFWKVLVWLALNRNGHPADYPKLTFDRAGVILTKVDDEATEGKDEPDPAPASES